MEAEGTQDDLREAEIERESERLRR